MRQASVQARTPVCGVEGVLPTAMCRWGLGSSRLACSGHLFPCLQPHPPTRTPPTPTTHTLLSAAGAPFNKPFYLIFNLALAGPTTPFAPTPARALNATLRKPKQLQVDYVRVFGIEK
jgi:hypothetical protein